MAQFTKVQKGAPVGGVLSASYHNAIRDALRWVEKERNRVGGRPMGGYDAWSHCVLVTNKSADKSDWPLWSPVAVDTPDGQPVERALAFAQTPVFRGYPPSGMNTYSVFGITQEPIRYGDTGRVCVRGPCVALLQSLPTGTTSYGGYSWASVWQDAGRWVLRNGPAGDMRLLQVLDFDKWQDGTDNDQYLALVDLCDVPNRFPFWNNEPEACPARSAIRRDETSHAYQPSGITTEYAALDAQLCGSCGWEVAPSAYGMAYAVGFGPPVCFTVGEESYGNNYGPAGDSWQVWPHLPGLRQWVDDWDTGAPPVRKWFTQQFDSFCAKADGLAVAGGCMATACEATGTILYDGSAGRPIVRAPVFWTSAPTRYPNTIANQILNVSYENQRFRGDPAYLDDPIGTIKIWAGDPDHIPQGWREYTSLQGRVPVGYKSGDADFGTLTGNGGQKTHTHPTANTATPGSTPAASAAQSAAHLPPYHVVLWIERYQ